MTKIAIKLSDGREMRAELDENIHKNIYDNISKKIVYSALIRKKFN